MRHSACLNGPGVRDMLAAAAAAKSLQSCPTLCDPTDAAHQAPPSLGFSRQMSGVGCHCLLRFCPLDTEYEISMCCPLVFTFGVVFFWCFNGSHSSIHFHCHLNSPDKNAVVGCPAIRLGTTELVPRLQPPRGSRLPVL